MSAFRKVPPLYIDFPQWDCPVHGNIKGACIRFTLGDGPETHWCIHCIVDALPKLGVQNVTRREEP